MEEETSKNNNNNNDGSDETIKSAIADEDTNQNNFSRKLFIVRHGERIDFTFKNWIKYCFDANGQYIRKDLNMPKTIPRRQRGSYGFNLDTPLTVMGTVQASVVGEAMKDTGVTFRHVYCSPSLRCIQTCHNLLKSLGALKLPINIEPGLFEWLGYYQQSSPNFMTGPELLKAGFNVNLFYKPFINQNELWNTHAQGLEKDKFEPFYNRSFSTTQHILNSTEAIGGNVLFIGHAATLDTCVQQLIGNKARSQDEFKKLKRITYCDVAMVQQEVVNGSITSSYTHFEKLQNQEGNGKLKHIWKLKEPPFPKLTHRSTECGYFEGQPILPWQAESLRSK